MSGFLYFLKCGDYVKVGYSSSPSVRVDKLRNATPYDVVLLNIVSATQADDARLRASLHEHHHRLEWFRLNKSVLDTIDAFVIGRSTYKVEALKQACDLVGGQRALSRLVGVSQSAISQAITCGGASGELALKIERATAGQITVAMLRPDLMQGAAA